MTSRLFQTLTQAQLDEVVQRHLPGAGACESKLATGGLFNTTYKLKLADGRRYMLIAGPVNRQLLLPYERQLMPAAAEAYRLLEAAGLPCPQIVAQASADSFLQRAYMLTKYIPGKPLSAPDIPAAAKDALYRQFGAYMHKMHAITADYWGRLSDTAAGRGYASWNDFVQATIETAVSLLQAHQLLADVDAQRVLACFKEAAPLFGAITRPALVHADLWEPNVLVSADNQQLTAVIDADRALFGDPDFDFPSPWLNATSFFDGYGRQPSQSFDAVRRRALYRMVYMAQDAYVWAVEYANADEAARCLAELTERSKELAG